MKKIIKLLSIVALTGLGSLYAATSLTDLQKEATTQLDALTDLIKGNKFYTSQATTHITTLASLQKQATLDNPLLQVQKQAVSQMALLDKLIVANKAVINQLHGKKSLERTYSALIRDHAYLGIAYYTLQALSKASVAELSKVSTAAQSFTIEGRKTNFGNALNKAVIPEALVHQKVRRLSRTMKKSKESVDFSTLVKVLTVAERESLMKSLHLLAQMKYAPTFTAKQSAQIKALENESSKNIVTINT